MILEDTICNLCGSKETTVLFRQRDSLQNCMDYEFPVVQCKKCGLVYISPRPSIQDIAKFYPETFISYQLEIHDIDEKANLNIRQKLLSKIVRAMARSRLRAIEMEEKLGNKIKVLDIGCGKASFLYFIMQKYDCHCLGIDFDKKSVDYNKDVLGVDVLEGDIHGVDMPTMKFDFITMWHFLEHEYDPMATIVATEKYLKDDGLLVIEVPNQKSFENVVFKERSYLYDVPRHLFSFSLETITELLKEAKFQVQKVVFPFSAGGWMGTLQKVLFHGKIYSDLQKYAFLFALLGMPAFFLDLLSNLMRKGSIIRIYAKKQSNCVSE